MNACECCGCMTWERYVVADGSKVCDYCEAQYREAKRLLETAPAPTPRDYNNLTWLLRQKHATVRNWAKLHDFSYFVVKAVLRRNGAYAETDIHKMSEQHFNVLMALCDDGYADLLINEEYITHV